MYKIFYISVCVCVCAAYIFVEPLIHFSEFFDE